MSFLNKNRTYTAGTLVYTMPGLFVLFGWLLWGDFVFSLMEIVMPSLLPLLMKAQGATNQEMIIIVSTIYMVMNAALNPIISYKSDRFRSRWGRRRPFIIFTTPFVVLFLAAIPFAPDMARWVAPGGITWRLPFLGSVTPLILLLVALVAGFQTFNMFVSTVYYYLIPDVVPADHVGRFFGLFRVCGNLAGIGYNYFIFGWAGAHMKIVFSVVALVYGFFILLMCWRVKEGEYPPPPRDVRDPWWLIIRNYLRECFGHSYYWWAFLTNAALLWSGSSSLFAVFFFRDELHMSLDLLGKVGALSGMLMIIFAYPFGVVIDRFGCQRTLIISTGISVLCALLTFFFTFDAWSGACWSMVRSLPMGLGSLAIFKWTVEVYPRERFGQFSSAGALFFSIGGIFLGPICGWWMDWVQDYRFFLIWYACFSTLGLFSAIVVYRRWRSLGGPEDFRAP